LALDVLDHPVNALSIRLPVAPKRGRLNSEAPCAHPIADKSALRMDGIMRREIIVYGLGAAASFLKHRCK